MSRRDLTDDHEQTAGACPLLYRHQGSVVRLPLSAVEISVSCRDLPNMDRFSKSDPMCTLSLRDVKGIWTVVDKTEIIWNNLNPNFVKKFVMDYYFDRTQELRFDVYDIDDKKKLDNLSKQDYIGYYECLLSGLVRQPVKTRLRGTIGAKGTINITAEELSSSKDNVTVQFRGHHLDRKDTFGKSDPFLVLHKVNEDGSFTIVHKTGVKKGTTNPVWDPFTLSVRALCNADYDRPLQIECYDHNKNGKHSLIGVFTTTLEQLKSKKITHFACSHSKRKSITGAKQCEKSGVVELVSIHIESGYTFLDYIQGGTDVHCTIAVDFTTSPSDSLHQLDGQGNNLFSKALQALGNTLEDYDSDRIFPAFGFGGMPPPYQGASQLFNLSGDEKSPDCDGVDDVITAYRSAVGSCRSAGQANFAPCINHVASEAEPKTTGSDYFILIIVTTGQISDLEETKKALVKCSSLPLSIIIVGIGDGNFHAMESLDADKLRLYSDGQYAEKDNVQFVPFRDYARGRPEDAAAFSKVALEEIPDQFMWFMKYRGLKPGDGAVPRPGRRGNNTERGAPPEPCVRPVSVC